MDAIESSVMYGESGLTQIGAYGSGRVYLLWPKVVK